MLKLTDIKKDYKVASGAVHALKGVSLQFRKSEFVCILGPSGCGKTTLLNIIGGLDHYTSGDLVIQGRSTKDFKDRDWDVYRNHRIGFVFQNYNLIPHQNVLSNVELALTIAGVGKEERKKRAAEALERVGLGEELNKRPNQLSGGQMQRVAIARALVNNPDILLADEPTGALDSKTSVQIMDLMKEIASERLVIMVTHNPELAEQYATRIVRLHDGLVEEDSAPYSAEEEAAEIAKAAEQSAEAAAPAETAEEPTMSEVEAQPVSAEQPPKKKKREKKPRAKMGFLTSLALSARNLLTKKGRTIITSVAGSIGIISVCLVLALSSGFNSYIRRTEEDMLSYYPVEIQQNTLDLSAVMDNAGSMNDMPDMDQIGDKVYVNSFLTQLAQGIAVTNNISEDYLNYLEKGKADHPDWISAIKYSYGVTLTDNLFTQVTTGGVKDQAGNTTEVKDQNVSLSFLRDFYSNDLVTLAPEYKSLLQYVNFFDDILGVMPGTSDFEAEEYGKYVQDQYDIIAGEFPKNMNEAVLVVGETNEMTDLTLAQLGYIPESSFMDLFKLGEQQEEGKDTEPMTVSFDDILKKQYTLFYNDAVYTKDANALPTAQPFTYSGSRSSLNATDGEDELGMPMHVSAIVRLKEGRTYGCLTEGLNFTEAAIANYISHNMKSEIVKWMLADEGGAKMKIPAGVEIPDDIKPYINEDGTVYLSPSMHLSNGNYFGFPVELPLGTTTMYINVTQDTVLRLLGGSDKPNGVFLYPSDFDAKEHVLEYLDAWNNANGRAEEDKITYTDRVGLLMGIMQTMLDVITYVLVAFTSISLIVSSVMIGIITYVSVVERVKEIGVLRSLGASKRDIKNLFNAETFIIGLAAGVFGVAVTYILSFIVSAVIKSFTGIAGIASLQPLTAFIMICVSVALTLISGLIPAAKAAKKDPVIALRTE